MTEKECKNIFTKIEKIIRDNIFEFDIPNENKTSSNYYPEFLKEKLEKYEYFFTNELNDLINREIPTINNEKDKILFEIQKLNKVIIDSIDKYYNGKIYEANKLFSDGIESSFLDFIQIDSEIPIGKIFYRARIGNEKQYTKKDLFHVDFNNRHLVSTNRYSIPGIPALYLGDSSYVCWEEFDRPRLRELWFTSLENTKTLKIIEILLIEDALEKIQNDLEIYNVRIIRILSYLIHFPLTLATTIKVKNNTGSFKPEYIISQILLEYIMKNDKIDGIKFPSTKINYKQIVNVKCYNYVFPVKTSKKVGICSRLEKMFKMTNPTSLEMLELLNNPAEPIFYLYSDEKKIEQTIEIVENEKQIYLNTSFGKIEHELKKLKLMNVL